MKKNLFIVICMFMVSFAHASSFVEEKDGAKQDIEYLSYKVISGGIKMSNRSVEDLLSAKKQLLWKYNPHFGFTFLYVKDSKRNLRCFAMLDLKIFEIEGEGKILFATSRYFEEVYEVSISKKRIEIIDIETNKIVAQKRR